MHNISLLTIWVFVSVFVSCPLFFPSRGSKMWPSCKIDQPDFTGQMSFLTSNMMRQSPIWRPYAQIPKAFLHNGIAEKSRFRYKHFNATNSIFLLEKSALSSCTNTEQQYFKPVSSIYSSIQLFLKLSHQKILFTHLVFKEQYCQYQP